MVNLRALETTAAKCPVNPRAEEAPLRDLSPFEILLRQLEARTGFRVVVVDLLGVFRMIPELRLSPGIQEHRSSLCLLAKSMPGGWDLCSRNKACASSLAARSGRPISGYCRMGIAEHVEPLSVEGQLVGLFYLGQVRMSEAGREGRKRLEAASRSLSGTESRVLKRAFLELPRRSHQEFGQALLELRAVLDLAAAVVKLDALPLRDLRFHLKGVEWTDARELPPLVRRALLAIDRIPLDQLSAGFLAQVVGCSREHLSKVFGAGMGLSIGRYIHEHRLERAKRLIQSSSLSIGEVAHRCGYSDASHLGKCVLKSLGQTPTQLRNLSGGAAHQLRRRRATDTGRSETGQTVPPTDTG